MESITAAIRETSASIMTVGALAAAFWLGPQLIEGTGSPCAALVMRQISTQPGRPSLADLAASVGIASQASQMSCAGYYWDALATRDPRPTTRPAISE